MMAHTAFIRSSQEWQPGPEHHHWGQQSLLLDLPGGPYRVTGLHPDQCAEMQPRCRHFILEHENAEAARCELSVHQATADRFVDIDLNGWEYDIAFNYQPHQVTLSGYRFYAEIDMQDGFRARLWTCEQGGEHFRCLIENLLRIMAAYRVLTLGGILLHSACITRNEQAYLLFGHSGSGKSTSSRIAYDNGWSVLSDDMNALVPEAGGVTVIQVPFTGELTRPTSYQRRCRAAGIFRLRQAPQTALADCSPAQGMALLMSCIPFLNRDPYRSRQLMDNIMQLITAHPVKTLYFTPDKAFLNLIEVK